MKIWIKNISYLFRAIYIYFNTLIMKDVFRFNEFFIHQRLILQLLDSYHKTILSTLLQNTKHYDDHLKQTFINDSFTEVITKYFAAKKIKSLEELLITNSKLKKGQVIWFYNNFYFKGIVKASKDSEKGKLPAYAEFYIHLKRYNKTIKGKYNYEHVHWYSATDRLSGHKSKFIVAYIDGIQKDEIVLRPMFISDRFLKDEILYEYDSPSLKLDISEIDEFNQVKCIPHDYEELDIQKNKGISEERIKHSIAEILYENNIPKDWGGESSDLFTNHIHIDGKRYNAAFLLKGPSKFHQMTVKDLGVNGNQIVRLFDEPAEILVLLHCHYIKAEIYKTMDAFASRFDNIRRYCVIDGIDTQRLLMAYEKM